METKSISGLDLNHEEFIENLEQGKVDFLLPKHLLIKIFYNIPIEKWRQIIMQIILLLMWGAIILGLIFIIIKILVFKYNYAFYSLEY